MTIGLVMAHTTDITLDNCPANATFTNDRTIDCRFTSTTTASLNQTCNLTIGTTTQPTNTNVTSGSATTLIGLTIPDGDYNWSVKCVPGNNATGGNTSETRLITIGFNYAATDIPKVVIDSVVGILALLFSLVALIGIVLMYRWIKK